MFILKDAFQIFKCMCSHITVPQDKLQMTQSLLYLSHALGLYRLPAVTCSGAAEAESGGRRGKEVKHWFKRTLIFVDSNFSLIPSKKRNWCFTCYLQIPRTF